MAPFVVLSRFVDRVLQIMQDETLGVDVAAALALERALAPNMECKLLLDTSLDGSTVQDTIFDILISSTSIEHFGILFSSFEATEVEGLLEKFIAAKTTGGIAVGEAVTFMGNAESLTASALQRIIVKLNCISSFRSISLFDGFLASLPSESLQVVAAVLRGELLRSIIFVSIDFGTGTTSDRVLPEMSTSILCEAIGQSTTLHGLLAHSPPTTERMQVVSQQLAQAIENSTSIGALYVVNKGNDRIFQDAIEASLRQTEVVKNFHLFFRRSTTTDSDGNDTDWCLDFQRGVWYTNMMPRAGEIPENLWGSIINDTNSYNTQTSHSALDATFFVIRENWSAISRRVHKRPLKHPKRYPKAEH